MTVLNLFPARIAVGYANVAGKQVPIFASPEFLRALQGVFERIGGATGASTTDLATADDDDSGTEEMKLEFAKALDGLASAPPFVALAEDAALTPPSVSIPADDLLCPIAQEPPPIDQLMTELAGLREQVALLCQQINDLRQGTTP